MQFFSQNSDFLRIKFEMNQYLFKSTVFPSLTAAFLKVVRPDGRLNG